MTIRFSRRTLLGATGVAALALAACSSGNPLDTNSPSTGSTPTGGASGPAGKVTVGSAGFAESEIIAELYAQALEHAGLTVERRMQIGARDAYYKALTDGSIDLIPEYTGNLLQFLDPTATASAPDEIVTALKAALPKNLRVLTPAAAEDKDAWCVTSDFSTTNGIKSLSDLAGSSVALRLAGNPELAERPYGPKGLTKFYGVPADRMTFTPIDDGGGPLTIQALVKGDVDMADIYSTTPAIKDNNLVVLEDPKHMIIAQNVVPLASDVVPADAVLDAVLDAVSKALTTDDLIAMNARNQGDEKAAPAKIATDWLKQKGLLG